MSSRWWKAYIFGGIGLWVGAILAVASQQPMADRNGLPVRLTIAVGGALYFAGLAILGSRVEAAPGLAVDQRDLAARLALQDQGDAAAVAVGRMGQVRRVYLGFAAGLVGLGLTAVAIGGGPMVRAVLAAMAVLAVAWVGYFIWAFPRIMGGADAMLGPLGLRLTEVPGYLRVPDLSGGSLGGGLVGAMAYGGERHGRPVTITQHSTRAVTVVGVDGTRTDLGVPVGPEQLSALTGLSPSGWRNVVVGRIAEGVAVTRTGNGAGAWLLHDLLLAEAVADVLAGRRPA